MSDYPSTAQIYQWHDRQASFKFTTHQLEERKAPCISTAWERTGRVIMTRHTACIHRRYAELNSQALQFTGAQPHHVKSRICQDRHYFRTFQCYDFLFVCLACGILVPRPGMEPVLPALGVQVLIIGSPGKSPSAMIFIICNYLGSNS